MYNVCPVKSGTKYLVLTFETLQSTLEHCCTGALPRTGGIRRRLCRHCAGRHHPSHAAAELCMGFCAAHPLTLGMVKQPESLIQQNEACRGNSVPQVSLRTGTSLACVLQQ